MHTVIATYSFNNNGGKLVFDIAATFSRYLKPEINKSQIIKNDYIVVNVWLDSCESCFEA